NKLQIEFNSAIWYSHGYQQPQGKLSKIASYVIDNVYKYTPIVHSEIVNRDTFSTPASKAIKDLLKAMFTANTFENLGYEDSSASASLYRTTIKTQGIHVKQNKRWQFITPEEENNPALFHLWNIATQYIE